jgi:SAM-dependent methyltransferase
VPIADSSAVKDTKRILAQHQSALTLLQLIVSDPSLTKVEWLDLACGRGQIMLALEENLTPVARAKIIYNAYDADPRYLRETEKTASGLGFAAIKTKIGDLESFSLLADAAVVFDFVTFTNTAHEVRPSVLAKLLVDVVLRLSPRGYLFVYDMEYINPPELGAIAWSSAEFASIVKTLTKSLGNLCTSRLDAVENVV